MYEIERDGTEDPSKDCSKNREDLIQNKHALLLKKKNH